MSGGSGSNGRPATTLDVFDDVVRTDPDRTAFVAGDQRMTFGHWAALADGLARRWAREHGVTTGDVVAIQLPSSIDYAVAYQAAMRLGAIASGINPRLGPSERAHILERSAPKVLVDGPLGPVTPGDPLGRHADVAATDPVAIVWTSGTTGRPKGAVFDHACLEAMTLGAAPLSEPGDVRLSPLPFAHVGYMTRVWDELVHRITTVIAPVPWSAGTTLEVLERERVTVCQGVPTQYRLLFDHPRFDEADLSSLRIAGIGAARIPPELVTEMRDRLGCPVVVRYASTECSLATGTRLTDDAMTVATTVGRPNGAVELRITDDHGDVEPGEVGVVTLRSRAMMRGYWREPELTAEAITPDGWLRTGDLGWVGTDGNLRLVGRHTEMYIRGGYNVYPAEVENCLGGHESVAACAVVGTATDDRLGEIGVLFLQPRDPAHPPSLDELRRYVKERLADYKAPDAVELVDAIPVTAMGKIDKLALGPRAQEVGRTWQRR